MTVRRGRDFILRPVLRQDYDQLYLLALSGENAIRWKYRGSTPSPEAFAAQLWAGVFAQYVVARPETGAIVGLVGAYQVDPASGTAFIFALGDPDAVNSTVVFRGLVLFCDAILRSRGFRKLYFEVSDFNLPQFESTIRRGAMRIEGRLIEHEAIGGAYVDLLTLAVTQDHWRDYWSRLADWIAH